MPSNTPATPTPKRRIVRIAATLALALPLLFAVSATAEAATEMSCSVQRTNGGLLLRWTEVPDATQYQYKLQVAGEGNRYRRVTGSEAVIELDAGVKGSVSIAPIFADGSTQSRISCGSQTPTTFTCSVTAEEGGVRLSWSSVEDATAYRYRLTSQGVNRFGELTGTSAFIATAIRTDIEIGLTAVHSDGSVDARTNCGKAGSATDPEPADGSRSCSVSSVPGGVAVSWTSVDGAARYQYKAAIAGKGNVYRRVGGTEAVIEAAPGTTISVGVNPIFNDGSTLRRVDCGTATAG